jgi:excisionase family DNA binding protein
MPDRPTRSVCNPVRIANGTWRRATESEESLVSDGVVRLDHQLLTAREVADLLRLPVSTVYELARTGRLPYLRIGRAMRFSQRDLEAHLGEACRAEPSVRRSDVG